MTIVEILRAARSLVETRGLHQNTWFSESGAYCSLGAIAAVATGVDKPCSWEVFRSRLPVRAFAAAARLDTETSFDDLVCLAFRWSDKHSLPEVLAAFDRAIAAEEAKAQEFNVAPAALVEDREHVAV